MKIFHPYKRKDIKKCVRKKQFLEIKNIMEAKNSTKGFKDKAEEISSKVEYRQRGGKQEQEDRKWEAQYQRSSINIERIPRENKSTKKTKVSYLSMEVFFFNLKN